MQATPHFSLICQLGEDNIIQKCRASRFCCRASGFSSHLPCSRTGSCGTILRPALDFTTPAFTTINCRALKESYTLKIFKKISYSSINKFYNKLTHILHQNKFAFYAVIKTNTLESFLLCQLSDYELCIAANLVDPSSMNVCWDDIGGLQETIDQILDTVIFPFRRRDLFPRSQLVQPPKGL